MAKFQFSISRTITLDTADWPREGIELFAEQLRKQSWRDDNGMVPTAEMHDAAMAALIRDDAGLMDTVRYRLRDIEAKDVKVVCIDRDFSYPPPLSIPSITGRLSKPNIEEIEKDAGAQTDSGKSKVAESVKQPDAGAKGTNAPASPGEKPTPPIEGGKGPTPSNTPVTTSPPTAPKK